MLKQTDIDRISDKQDAITEEENETLVEVTANKYLLYGILNKTLPCHVTILCGLQQALLALSGSLVVSLLVAEAVCAENDQNVKAKLLSSTLFMNGITTVAMNLFGIRLPLFQGASSEYIVPLLLLANDGSSFCSSIKTERAIERNITTNMTEEQHEELIMSNIQALQGSLMVAGLIHAFLGLTGLIGVLLRYIGPLTIVPTLMLIFIFIVKPVINFVQESWPIALSTVAVGVILSLYLAKHNMPLPVWTPSGGCRIIRYPLHQVFSILISIIFNWGLCAILTAAGVFPDDPNALGYKARTDARNDVIRDNPWFNFPYPGQFGPISFSAAALISFLIATLISVLDSIGDYYACARVCRVPAPPSHAVNRGIMIEGLCSFLSGTVGCGHATSTNGGCLGAIGVTRVASRQVFIVCGIFYILFGVFGKFSAIFVTIPYPVLGGAVIVLFGIFFGVIISNLEVTKMGSSRNIAVLGLSVFIGLTVPTWAQSKEKPIDTGDEGVDNILTMLLSNPNLIGTLLAFFLDNTVPGTAEERGIAAWQVPKNEETIKVDPDMYDEGYEVYEPLMPESMMQWKIMKYLPFLPYRPKSADQNDTVLSKQM
ncbi:solute carrier family 23 member 2-like isoform X2 [Mercenaria mercenaria]|uniref:solute carrier family 23 member 2-like isoform X2 n=1 Tax=Mercenaria mercenaria TaxID=6596 RepID=UPI00234F3D71|nr:solute carrier family 23 member 2-like isoform X2 [Mercenaria mercenaria]